MKNTTCSTVQVQISLAFFFFKTPFEISSPQEDIVYNQLKKKEFVLIK